VSAQPEPVNEEFEAFRDEFLDANLAVSGVPPEQWDLWRDLRAIGTSQEGK